MDKIGVTAEDLAQATGHDAADFSGLLVAQDSPALRQLAIDREKRLLSMAGMSDTGEGPIGLALIVSDVKKFFQRIKKKK